MYTKTASIMVFGNQAVPRGNHAHLQVAVRPFHVWPKRKPE